MSVCVLLLAGCRGPGLRQTRLLRAEARASQAVGLARTRHESGLIAYFEVLAAEQELAAARDAAVRSRTAVVVAMMNLYRSLAGAPGGRP